VLDVRAYSAHFIVLSAATIAATRTRPEADPAAQRAAEPAARSAEPIPVGARAS
jgi:hypothetical protein